MDRKEIKDIALVLGFLLVVSCLTVVLHGLLVCRSSPLVAGNLQKDWPTYAQAEVLDSHSTGDSAILLVRQNTGRLWLLEFEKNLIFNRYAMKDDTPVKEGHRTAVVTVQMKYPVHVAGEKLDTEGELKTGFDCQELVASYGVIWLLLAVAFLAAWRKSRM